MQSWIRPILGAVLCAIVAGSPAWAAAPGVTAPAIGAIPPALLGPDASGHAIDLTAYRGKVVVVTFWASWCSYCLRELPALNALQRSAGNRWLQIVAINVQDEPGAYRLMMRQMRAYTLVMTRDRSGAIAAGYGVNAYPNLWMIDPQGQVAAHHMGYDDDSMNTIIDEIKRLLTLEMQRQQAPVQAEQIILPRT